MAVSAPTSMYTRAGRRPHRYPALTGRDWLLLLALVVLAGVVRVALMNGPLGSDDVVYLGRALDVANGVWSSANYNGALRYGFNIPAGFLLWMFGVTVTTANLWPLTCSLAEVAVVYAFARKLWDRRTAFFAAAILASLPLHIAVAMRIHADPVLAFFLTASFALFWFAETRHSRRLYFATGLLMGMVFWVKELALAALVAFVLYPVLWRRVDRRWGYIFAGGGVMLAAHLVLMQAIAGDPLHLFKIVSGQVSRSFIQGGQGEDSVAYYFRYLFFDVKHTWLAPLLAAVMLAVYVRQRVTAREVDPGLSYTVFWLLALLGTLTFLPVSLVPLRFAMKQSNYLNLFLAPIAILAAVLLARMKRRFGYPLFAVTVLGGLVLGALEQQAYRVFTSNSKAAVEFAQMHPRSVLFGTLNNSRMAHWQSLIDDDPTLSIRFESFSDARDAKEHRAPIDGPPREAYAILDAETMGWIDKSSTIASPPACWKQVETLVPSDFGVGRHVPEALLVLSRTLPADVAERAERPLAALLSPKPALVYAVNPYDLWCERP